MKPAPYVDDNRCTLDALRRMAPHARGVGVLRLNATDTTLKEMDAGGIRGLRFALNDPRNKAVTVDMTEPMATRIAPLGWHVQIQMTADQIIAAAPMLSCLPTPVVFDHMGNIPPSDRVRHPVLPLIISLLERGRPWVKLSASVTNTDGPPYAGLATVARRFVDAAPNRVIWGSNWPHPNDRSTPDDAVLLDAAGAVGSR